MAGGQWGAHVEIAVDAPRDRKVLYLLQMPNLEVSDLFRSRTEGSSGNEMDGAVATNRIQSPNPYGELDVERLRRFQHENGIELPDDYLLYLAKFNGGKFERGCFRCRETDFAGIHHMYGLHDGPEYCRIDERHCLSDCFDLQHLANELARYCCIADTGSGDVVVLDLADGSVWCFLHDQMQDDSLPAFRSALVKVASSFEEFAENLVDSDDIAGLALTRLEQDDFVARLEEMKRQRRQSLE